MGRKIKNFRFPVAIILISLTFVVLGFLLLNPAGKAETLPWTVTRLTFDPSRQAIPDISGDKVVWVNYLDPTGQSTASTTNNIYLYDLETHTGQPITETDNKPRGVPYIYGDNVVYAEYPAAYSEADFYVYNIPTQMRTKITTNDEPTFYASFVGVGADIYQDKVVWAGWRGIHLYDLTTNEDKVIGPNSDGTAFEAPKIYGRWVVWEDHNTGYIYAYDFESNTFSKTDLLGGIGNRVIYGNTLAFVGWSRYPGGVYGYHIYNLLTGEIVKTLSDSGEFSGIYDIYENKLLLGQYTNGTYGLIIYNLDTDGVSQVRDAGHFINWARMDSNKIVWEGDDQEPGNIDIYLATPFQQPPTVTISSVSDEPNPLVTGSAESSISPIKSIEYQIDGTDPDKWIPLSPAVIKEGFLIISNYVRFAFNLPKISSGSHILYMRASDINNNMSEIVSAPFHVPIYIEIEDNLSSDVVEGKVLEGFPNAVIQIINKKQYWTKVTIQPLPPSLNLKPYAGDIYAQVHLLGPGASATYVVNFQEVGNSVYVFVDPTIESGQAAPLLNVFEMVTHILPVVRDVPKENIIDLLEALKDIDGIMAASQKVGKPNASVGDYISAAWDIIKVFDNPQQLAKLRVVLIRFVGYEGGQLTYKILKSVFTIGEIINAARSTYDMMYGALAGSPSGSLLFRVR